MGGCGIERDRMSEEKENKEDICEEGEGNLIKDSRAEEQTSLNI